MKLYLNLIQLYTSNKQDLTKNGIILNPINGKIHVVLNSENELEIEVILDKDGLYKHINRGCLIATQTPEFNREQQAYRIYNTVKNMSSNTMTVYARHIQFDLNKKVIFNKNVQGKGQEVIEKLLEDTNFKGTSESNITDIRQYKMRNITNILNGSEEDSFLKIWGGEIECNNYKLNIPLKRGKDRGVRISFGYNLEDIEEDINSDELVTRIFPYSGDLVLSENTPYVDSPLIAKYQDIYEQPVEMSDIKVKEKTKNSDGNDTTSKDAEGFETRAEAEAEMIKRCKKLYDEGADKIKANYKVKMQDLSKTIEYKQLGYDVLEKICLGDTVHCYNKNIDIEVSARCISYEWDIVNEEFIEIELGQFISNFIDNNLNDLDNLYRKIVLTEQFITLRVDSLDNTLHSEIKLTEDAIRAEAEDTKKGLISKIELTAKGLTEDYTNKTDDLHTEITKTAKGLESKVSKGEDFGTELEQNAKSVLIAIKDETDMNVIFDHNGQTIKNGALIVKDSKNKTIMRFNQNGSAGVKDLYIEDVEKGSQFYTTLLNMPHLDCQHLCPEKLVIEHKNFYIDDGYDLKQYIKKIISES
ncbi:phage tail spike protein [Clostridium uliginosum]|uniref:Phage minor structural protein, N-terminal region n=1 Tax=Clostridium uliginosum TaxID=119641 RepID=A0A1I1GZP0_9CLOT|nr:phage tail spike protein [Clostridium uliginosum]SFC15318.1 phage minor structural protein, N-terminal region [Clostridium uliginosum]